MLYQNSGVASFLNYQFLQLLSRYSKTEQVYIVQLETQSVFFPGIDVGTNLIKCQARKFAEDLSEYTAGIAQRALAGNLWSFYIFLTVL